MNIPFKIAIVAAAVLSTAGCSSAFSSRWTSADEVTLQESFGECKRYDDADTGETAYDCGLYIFKAWGEEEARTHAGVVDEKVAKELEEPLTGDLESKDHKPASEWEGQPTEMSIVIYKPKPDTIIQPSVELYVSQKVGSERQFFSCFHTLAMVTDEANAIERIAPCYKGIKALALASR